MMDGTQLIILLINQRSIMPSRLLSKAVLAALSMALSAATTVVPMASSPVVETANGSYFGSYNSAYKQDHFLGIPYAQPPLGDLRFAPPRSLNSSWSGLRNATHYGLSCIGYFDTVAVAAQKQIGEDCLSLNVVRPAGKPAKALPVAVWIHGFVCVGPC